MKFETIKRNYERKLWSRAQDLVAVRKGVITPEEYQEITREEYTG